MSNQKVKIYSTENCPYCVKAKNFFKNKGIKFEEIRVDLDTDKREEMVRETGRKSVPQIFIGDTHIGGCDDLMKLNQEGKLEKLLEN